MYASRTLLARTRLRAGAVLAAGLALVLGPVLAAGPAAALTSQDIDTSWGSAGQRADVGWAALVQRDAATLTYSSDQRSGDLVLSRLTAGGALDPAFGGGSGRVRLAYPRPGEPTFSPLELHGVVELPDSRLLLSATSGNLVELVRLLPSGAPDTSFGPGGARAVSFPLDPAWFGAQVAGPVLLPGGGSVLAVSQSSPRLLRFDAAGRQTGSTLLPPTPCGFVDPDACDLELAAPGIGLAARPDGTVDVLMAASGKPYLTRVTPSGALDTAYGTGGILPLPLGRASNLVLAPGGDLVVSGSVLPSGGHVPPPVTVVRLSSTGALRTTWGRGGVATAYNGLAIDPHNATSASIGQGAAVDGQGRVVVAGLGLSTVHPDRRYCSVTRFTTTGALDRSFSLDGDGTSTDGRRNADWCPSVYVDPAGGYLVNGLTLVTNGTSDYVERFRP
ncbi:putative delta-60 repeat protein [Motilibacter peucedani]|uniref:Putative delta-60 repeat protein n=1 Tax=Motilibacter peucedani TaxID=598650 RepID=A0A420XRL3_9ACTN|nr:hypothetical protein [Motilibacter peucedani]RKS77504.1 putative delta-60 repeat protein [Motilibacter peucedani]